MLYKWALSMAQSFYVNSGKPYDEDDIEDYAYGLEMLVENVFELLAVFLIGVFMGRAFETIVFILAFISLRGLAGGYHSKTSFRCFLTFLAVYGLFLAIIHFTPLWLTNYIALISVGLSAISIFALAPVPHPNKPIGQQQHKFFRKMSITVFLIQAFIIVGLAALGIVPFIGLSLAIGQLSAATSLLAAKIQYANS